MYENFFRFFGLRENPFDGSLDPRYQFLTPALSRTLDQLAFAVERPNSFVLLTGEVRVGERFLLLQFLESLRQRGMPTAFIFSSHLDCNHRFDFLLADFGIRCASRPRSDALQELHRWLLGRRAAGQTPVLVVDEAQGLSSHAFHE